MSAITVLSRAYTPLAFRPPTDRFVVLTLTTCALALWFAVLPLELALGLHLP